MATWPYREEIVLAVGPAQPQVVQPGQRYGGQPRYYRTDVGESTGALGLAAAGGKLYVSLFYENKLLVLDAATGKPTGEADRPSRPGRAVPARRATRCWPSAASRWCGSTWPPRRRRRW